MNPSIKLLLLGLNSIRERTNGRYKIIFSLSVALAIFYSLPWIALSEQSRIAGNNIQPAPGGRVLYLFISVFLTSILFFQYNLFWKGKVLALTGRVRPVLNLLINLMLMIAVSGVLILIATILFNINAPRAFFIFYLFRNTGIMLIVMLVTYVIELVDKSRVDKIEILTLQNKNSETELSALRSQIDPHFLFNSLTSLSGLIRANSKEALEFVNHLSETFRYILEKREHKLVTVQDELRFVASYIFMLQKRFADSFRIEINIEEAHLTKNIPQFALQIMVENAIKHNLLSAKNPLTIDIRSLGNNLRVRNNLQLKKTVSGYGIGLTNLSKRYQLIGRNDIIIRKTPEYFEVELPLL
ncbi:histidine kinase [Chryseolinea sp. H1M3-3]|uniref:sensor histidine kinase n=1 Tax=Chryseolinea sp. H1M3-3 TaxID=3034144 RepID=UPI0023ECD240|nr:histidine kinase [Chryseolinea sp. H1M3-3]